MRAGLLRQRGTIQRKDKVADNYGGYTHDWVDEDTVWMRVEPTSGKEQVYGMQLEHQVTHRITMRYREITADRRILHKGMAYNIRFVLNEDSKGSKLTLLAEQGVAT